MKGISKEMVILIAIVVLVVALLYFAWIKGLLPFSIGVTEAECHAKIMDECSKVPDRLAGGANNLQELSNLLKVCWGFVSKQPNAGPGSNCDSCKTDGTNVKACQLCCAQDLAGWTVR